MYSISNPLLIQIKLDLLLLHHLSPILPFSLRRKRGRQASYNGFMYSKDKTHNSGTTSWQFKDRKLYTPPCKGRLNTLDDRVSNERTHCHEPSITMVIRTEFIYRVKRNNTNEKPSDVIRDAGCSAFST